MATNGTVSMNPSAALPHRNRLQQVSLGMVFLGVIFSSILYGVMISQTQKYFERFKKDQAIVKTLVSVILILNTASVIFACHAGWYYLITNGSPKLSIWSLNVELALSMLMSALTETFLALRVYKLSGNNVWLTGILLALVLLHFGSGEVAAIELLLLKKHAMVTSVKVPTILRLSSAAFCDTAIAVSLSYYLHTKRTGFKRSDEMIDYLILFSINSGLMLSATSIGSLILYIVVPSTWVYIAFCFLLSRLYATTFLSSLNSRQILFNDTFDEKDGPILKIKPSTHLRHRSRRSNVNWALDRQSQTPDKTPTQIYVVTETITDNVPQHLNAGLVPISRSPIDVSVKELPETSSSTGSDTESQSGDSSESM